MNTVQELRLKAQKTQHEAKSILDEMHASKDEARAKELEAQFDRAIAEADKLYARADSLEALEKREAALNVADPRRPIEAAEVRGAFASKSKEERHASIFDSFVRGVEMSPEVRAASIEFRDQSVGTASAGGYLVPTTLVAQLIKSMKFYGPMMDPDAANHIQTATGNPMNWPTMDDTSNTGSLITEASSLSTVSLTFGQKSLGAYKYTSNFFKVSSELLQDAAVNPSEIIINAIGERLGRILNTHLTVGTGSGQPTGIVTAVGTPALTTVANSAVAYDDLVNTLHSVDIAYRNNPKTAFMWNDTTTQAIRKLKDNYGHPIWQPNFQVGQPDKILGYNYLTNNDMAAIGTGNVPVLFGDFSKYFVRVARDVTVKRADELFLGTDESAFVGFVRVDGNLMDAKAVKGLKVS